MRLLLLLLLCGALSCIHEDTFDCLQGLYIYFNPENKKHNYPELVQVVNLYFYDEVGNLVAEYIYTKEELYSDERAAFVENLPEGNYTLVSIINDVETYYTNNEQQLKSLQSYLKDREINYPLVDFFSGILELTVEREPGIQKATTDIFKHNNNIRLEIIMDGYVLTPEVTLNAYIEGKNGAYNYNSRICPEEHIIKYLPHGIETNDGIPITYDFTIMRLWQNSDINLCLQEESLFEGIIRDIRLNIADELAKVVNDRNEFLYDTDEKLSFTDEYKIVITLGPNFVLLELTINDWTIIRGGIDV